MLQEMGKNPFFAVIAAVSRIGDEFGPLQWIDIKHDKPTVAISGHRPHMFILGLRLPWHSGVQGEHFIAEHLPGGMEHKRTVHPPGEGDRNLAAGE